MQKERREYSRVVDHIYTLIETGQLTVGSRLPAERALAE